MDGNAYFFTAVDITRRLDFTENAETVVVGIGYPPSKYVYDWRRGPDLTPPTPDGKYDMPLDRNGKPRTDLSFGEADKFLDFIQNHVIKYVQDTLFPNAPLRSGRKALFGHSYGGVFALSALYTEPTLFDFFAAASPTIWWNNYSLVKYQESAFLSRESPADPPPSLLVTWGGIHVQNLVRRSGESDKSFQNRKEIAEEKDMMGSATALAGRLEGCPSVRDVWTMELPGEDHGSAAVVGLQRGIKTFLLELETCQ